MNPVLALFQIQYNWDSHKIFSDLNKKYWIISFGSPHICFLPHRTWLWKMCKRRYLGGINPILVKTNDGEKYFQCSSNIFTALIDLVHPIFPGGVGNGLEISQSKLLHCKAWCSQKMEFVWKHILSIFEQMRIYMRILLFLNFIYNVIRYKVWSITKTTILRSYLGPHYVIWGPYWYGLVWPLVTGTFLWMFNRNDWYWKGNWECLNANAAAVGW